MSNPNPTYDFKLAPSGTGYTYSNNVIQLTVGVFFSLTITYERTDLGTGPEDAIDVGLVNAFGSSTYLAPGYNFGNGYTITSTVNPEGAYTGITISGTPSYASVPPAGSYSVFVRGKNDALGMAGFDYRNGGFNINVAGPAMVVTPPGSGGGVVSLTSTVNTPFSQTFTITNAIGPFFIEVNGFLSPGMGFSDSPTGSPTPSLSTNSQTFYLLGTPTVATAVPDTWTTKVTSQLLNTNVNIATSLQVNNVGGSITIDASALDVAAKQLVPKQYVVTASGAASVNWSVSGLNSNVGTFTTSGNNLIITANSANYVTLPIQITATDTSNFANSFTITKNLVVDFNVVITSGDPLPGATQNSFYTHNIIIDGGDHNLFSFSSITGVPTGLTLSQPNPNTGLAVLSGTPTGTGSFTISFEGNASWVALGGTGFRVFSLPLVISSTASGGLTLSQIPTDPIPSFVQGTAVTPSTVGVQSAGALGAETFSIGSGTLPVGLSLVQSTNHFYFSGTPTAYTPSTVNINVIDNVIVPSAQSASISVPVFVIPAVNITGSATINVNTGDVISQLYNAIGGDNTAWSWSISAGLPDPPGPAPSWLSLALGGTNNEQATLYVNSTTGGVVPPIPGQTFHIALRATTTANGQPLWTVYNIALVIASSGVVITTAGGATSYCSNLTPFHFTLPPVHVIGGATNTYTISFTAPPGTPVLSPAAPYNSDQTGISITFPVVGTYDIVFTSVDSPGVSITVPIVVNNTSRTGSISPAGPVSVHGGDAPISFNSTVSGGCGNNTGLWNLLGDNPRVVGTIDTVYGSTVVYTPPSNIVVNSDTQLVFIPTEDSSATQIVIIHLVSGNPSNLDITTPGPNLSNGNVGTPYTVTFTGTGGVTPYFWSLTGPTQPPGLSLNSSSGVMSGTPTIQGTFNFTVILTDASFNAFSKSFVIMVTTGGAVTITGITPNSGPIQGGQPVTITGTGFVNDFNPITGNEITFLKNGAGVNRNLVSPVYVSPTSITGVTPVAPDNTAELVDISLVSVNVQVGLLSQAYNYTGGSTKTITSISPATLLAGTTNAPFTINGTGFTAVNSVTFTPQAPSVEAAFTLSNPVVSSNGLQITGTILTANLVQVKTCTVQVAFATGETISSPTNFTVSPAAFSISTSGIPDATRLVAYGPTNIEATGGAEPYTAWDVSEGSLPTGLSLARVLVSGHYVGQITGTPASNATSQQFTVRVTDSNTQVTTRQYILVVNGGAVSIGNTSFPDARIGQAYSVNLVSSGGTTPYTYSISAGSLPVGLAPNNSNFTLSGTPASSQQIGAYNFTLLVTDSTGGTPLTDSKSFTLNLLPALPSVTVTACTPNFGSTTGGTQVTITGTNFASGAQVKFGNTNATNVSVSSSTSLTCTTPAVSTAGVVTITVINADTSQGFLTNAFTYSVITAPVLQSIDNQDGPFAGGRTVVISGTNFTGVTSVKFGLTESGAFAASDIVVNTTSSPNTLTCKTPAFPIPATPDTKVDVNIFAQNSAGVGTGNNLYTYRPAPVITGILPSSGPTTGGQQIFVLGRNFFSRGNRKPRVLIGGVEIDPANITLVES